jgi:hypothetical protein
VKRRIVDVRHTYRPDNDAILHNKEFSLVLDSMGSRIVKVKECGLAIAANNESIRRENNDESGCLEWERTQDGNKEDDCTEFGR